MKPYTPPTRMRSTCILWHLTCLMLVLALASCGGYTPGIPSAPPTLPSPGDRPSPPPTLLPTSSPTMEVVAVESTPTASPTLPPTEPTPPTGPYLIHRAGPGQTLSEIAALYGVSVDQIAAASGLLQAGQPLTIPVSGEPITPTYHYMFPVQPPSSVTYGSYHHDYPAADIFGPTGWPVVAVTDGIIDELSQEDRWDPNADDPALRGGRYVSFIGDDGVRYYTSHLEAVVPWLRPGMRVVCGQLIGYLGNSGNARWTEPHVHFGLSRPTYPGDWAVRRGEIPPYDYLRAWEQGQDVTPELP